MKKMRSLLAGVLAATMALAAVPVWGYGAVRADVSDDKASEDVQITINKTNFPDSNFRNYISLRIDTNEPKGVLTQDEIDSVTEINCNDRDVANFKGIEFFTSLTNLECKDSDRLTELDLSSCVALKKLDCTDCEKLEKLVLTSNAALEELNCTLCSSLTSLDLSDCVALKRINCGRCHINDLVLGDHPYLTVLDCEDNYIDALDVTKYPQLKELWCAKNGMTKLKVNHNPELQVLICDSNAFSEITIYSSPYLQELLEVETPEKNSYFWTRIDDRVYYYSCSHNFKKYFCRFEYDVDDVLVTEAPNYTISVTANGSGTVTSSHSEAPEYTEVTLTATANEGNRFKSWLVVSGNGTFDDPLSATTTFVVGDSDVVIQAVFEKVPRTITLTTDGNGTASASVNAGFVGTTVTLTATPNSGYQFKSWEVISGGVTIADPTSAMTSFVIGQKDIEIKASFEAIPAPEPGQPVNPGQPGDPSNPGDPSQPQPGDPQPVKEPSFEDFIERMYVVALNRPSEPEGKAFWMDKVKNEGFTGGRVAIGFLIEAPEFLNRNLSDSDFVDVLYKTFFDRSADEGGKAFWMGHLATDMTREQVVRGFIDSTEWCNLCAYYGVKSGAPNAKAEKPSNNALKFATRLYTECLGREPDADGLQFWALRLTNLESSGYEAALGFFTSEEFTQKGIGDDEFIHRLYRTFMGRDEDEGGFAFWKSHLGVDMTREDLIKGFAQSQEFTNICNQYGIDRGEI